MKFLLSAALTMALVLAFDLTPKSSFACACGCGVFDVGTGSLFYGGEGGNVFIENDFMDQTRNFNGASGAPAADNSDKQIRSDFVTVGAQYMINHSWGVMAEVPVTSRTFKTQDDPNSGVETFNHAALGDIRLMGVYTGFSPDMSSGLILGVKLPTGDWKYSGFDRDVAIGSGSTDLLVGGYHRGGLTKDDKWTYFVQVMSDLPVAGQGGYLPGDEVDGAVGVYYNGWTLAGGKIRVAPLLQMIGSARVRDSGPAADPDNSGYERLMISPGIEVTSGRWRLYGDVEFPVYQRVDGNQLVAPELFKLIVSRSF